MKNKEYRELQVSSSQLVFIFLGILILCIVIFLLGVSVGKKQVQLIGESRLAAKKEVTEPTGKVIKEELASLQKVKEETKKAEPSEAVKQEPPKEEAKKGQAQTEVQKAQSIEAKKAEPSTEKKILFCIQVGAPSTKGAAQAIAKDFQRLGYQVVVLDPFPSDKKSYFRVRVGAFSTRQEAEAIRTKMESATKKAGYFIVRY
jgi:cell division septation protein DedD